MRLLIVNHAGDLSEAYHRLERGGPENYYGQRAFVQDYASLREYATEMTVLVRKTDAATDELLPNGVRAIGGGSELTKVAALQRMIAKIDPTHIIFSSPDRRLVSWLTKQRMRCLAAFAGSIPTSRGGLAARLLVRAHNRHLGFLLNQDCFEWVGSYGVASSDELVRAGVRRSKVIPWDLLVAPDSGNYPAKQLRQSAGGFTLCFVGVIQESKGVGDLIDAVAHLNADGFAVSATIVGRDTTGFARSRIASTRMEDRISLPGTIGNDEVEPLMHRSDAVIVPSRHEYPEGFPLVIHHGLRSRTPIVASDHPMFGVHLKDESSALLYRGGDSRALAGAIRRLLTSPQLYAQLSQNSDRTWLEMRLPVKWVDLVRRWLSGSPEDRTWLARHTLAGSSR